ncbi:MAG: hypothetical protein PHG13_02350 [Candidatus Pacebacteria bacterium]|nr:hypothetical protein [Candidatus Paceibacterota bacterium]MDD5721820.1 hypothetical protein [Candidatus Paceibacterota bacterium]
MNLQIKNYKMKAQSLIEILIAIGVGVILVGGSAVLIGASLNSYNSTKQLLQADFLMRQEAEAIQSLARNNWHFIYDLEKQRDYWIDLSENNWVINAGKEEGHINNIPFLRYFQVYDVFRDANGEIVEIGDEHDLNTQKVIIFLNYGHDYIDSTSLSFYLVRSFNNQTFHQFDWSEGDGQKGPIPNPGNRFDSAINIDFNTSGQITMATTTSNAELISSVLDTGIDSGAGYNSFLWLGAFNSGGDVKFQIAFSNSPSGPWQYYGPSSTEDWYQPNPNISYAFPVTNSASPQNNRYIRYKIYLSTIGVSPKVEDIIINWSP